MVEYVRISRLRLELAAIVVVQISYQHQFKDLLKAFLGADLTQHPLGKVIDSDQALIILFEGISHHLRRLQVAIIKVESDRTAVAVALNSTIQKAADFIASEGAIIADQTIRRLEVNLHLRNLILLNSFEVLLLRK